MAKSRQALSLWKGRAGGIVYSVLNGGQVMRSAPAQVANPKSSAQAAQRMKLAPAANFYRVLEGLVPLGFASHTFQGRKYGQQNRLRFMQLAMLNNQGPYVPKDQLTFVPFDYQISEGSLPALTPRVHVIENGTVPTSGYTAVQQMELTADNVQAFADVLGVKVGDQISFLNFFMAGNGNFDAEATRIKIVAGESIDLRDADIYIYVPTTAEGVAAPYASALFATDDAALAAVVSREQANGEFLRSSEFVVISDNIREQYYTPQALDAALASYMNGTTNNSASPYYNDLGNAVFDGTVYASPFKFSVPVDDDPSHNITGQLYVLWGKTSDGRKVAFTVDGKADGQLITIGNKGSMSSWDHAWAVDSTGEHYYYVRLGNLTTSAQWAGVEQWDSDYFNQWQSGQKAVRPIVNIGTMAAIDEDITPVPPAPEIPSAVRDAILAKFPNAEHIDIVVTNANAGDTTIANLLRVNVQGVNAPSAFYIGTPNAYGQLIAGTTENSVITAAEQAAGTINNGTLVEIGSNNVEMTSGFIRLDANPDVLVGLPTSFDL